jgi:hypothetical protein
MRKKAFVFFAVVFAITIISSMATAQPWKGWRGSGGWGPGTPYQQLYDPAKIETLTGEVIKIDQTVPMRRMGSGVFLMVKTDKETIAVHLGPSWYIERLDTKINVGDNLEIKGVRTSLAGNPAILTAEVKKGDAVLVLRDANGVPVWAGWGRRR